MSYETARKHVKISERIYKDVADRRPDLEVYFATHGRTPGYYKAEKESELNFRGISIRVYASEVPANPRILEPDGIIASVDGNQRIALYILEIKWGGTSESDLSGFVGSKQSNHILDAMCRGKSCRIAALKKDFRITEKTRFLLVSDFCELMKRCPYDCNKILENLDSLMPKLKCLDYKQTHDSDFGVIKSFHDYISST